MWYVYILNCDQKTFYVGMTMEDIDKHYISQYPDSYHKIRELMLETYDNPQEWSSRVIRLFRSEGIKIRQKDGVLYSIEPSVTPDGDAFIIELRYIKKDNNQTVDFFLINRGKEIRYFKTDGDIKSVSKNYDGNHKRQIHMDIGKNFIYLPPCDYITALRDYKKFIKKFGL